MKNAPRAVHAMFVVAFLFTEMSGAAFADEERSDRLTQTAIGLDPHPDAGKVQFERSCSRCHGKSAEGDDARSSPVLAGQRFVYLIRQLANFGSAERDNAAMHHNIEKARFEDPQAWNDMAAYLNRLPAAIQPKTGSGASAALGGNIFHQQCASCHQADASGDEEGFVPSLRNQHYHYLVNQLHRLAGDHRHNIDPSLLLLIRSFEETDFAAVADYLSRQRGPTRSHERMLGNGVVVD